MDASSAASCLLPGAGNASRVACEHRGVQIADVYSQLQCCGGDETEKLAFEKLVLDAEIIGMAKRLLAGIEAREETLALSVMRELGHRADYLTHPQTLRWFKEEFYIPSQVVDRGSLDAWERSGKHSAAQRAAARVEQLLKDYKPLALTDEMRAELRQITAKAAQSFGMTELPALDIFGE